MAIGKPINRNVLIAATTQNIFHELEKTLSQLKFSVGLEELQERYGEAVDMIILREQDEKHCEFLSGEFKISVVDADHYECSYLLYFQDADEEFHTLEAHSKQLDINFLTKDFQKDLRETGILRFEIDEPSLGIRIKYDKSVKEATSEKNVSV